MSNRSRVFSLTRVVIAGGVAIVAAVAGVGTFHALQPRESVDAYKERLDRLAERYDDLRHRHEEAVRRTAVTELHVHEHGRLDVVIRSSEGVLRTIETPYDPDNEIYVDYVVIDGRLWIRRIFDSLTPPHSALVIDPAFGEIDWDQHPHSVGKAIYRSLAPGRWVITVTGNGALGLARADDDGDSDLRTAPVVGQFDIAPDAANAIASPRPDRRGDTGPLR